MKINLAAVRLLSVAVPSMFVSAAFGDLYVAATGYDGNDGSAASPFRSIQAAVDAAPDEGCVIHVGEGSYYPKASDASYTLDITKPVRILASGDRDKTIIDGESKRRVVHVESSGALLAGFTITKGAYNSFNTSGGIFGGAYIEAGVVSNCDITANSSYYSAGALVAGGSLVDSFVHGNTSGAAAPIGVGVRITAGVLSGCEIYGQSQPTQSGSVNGAGVHVNGANAVVTNCLFRGLTCGGSSKSNMGGGAYLEGSGAILRNCLVAHCSLDNSSDNEGGGIYMANGTVENCTVADNTAMAVGGVKMAAGSLVNTIVAYNTSGDIVNDGGTVTSSPAEAPTFADRANCDYALSPLDKNFIDHGTARSWAEGSVDLAGNGRLNGEAVYINGASARMRNTLVAGNTGTTIGGVRLISAAEFSNCTVAGNVSRSGVAGVKLDGHPSDGINNLIWGNLAAGEESEIVNGENISFSHIGGADPLFRNSAKGDYRLRCHSPCIDAGHVTDWMNAGFDAAGARRLVGASVDTGCYENPQHGVMILLK